ncbi:MAG: DUF4389 domain-containing protein [Ilumatobacteraceae bacterium]
MKPARVILLVVGSLIALVGFGFVGAGVSLGWATATQRDDAGFFSTSSERFESDSFAITSDKIDLGDPGPDDWWADRELATVRVAVDSATAGELFVGIGPEAEVEAFLADVPHDEVTDVDFRPFSADYRRQNADGTAMPSPPMDETFWVAQAAGDATQTITWNLEPGNWVIVVMNADAVANVSADIELGGKLDYLVPIAIGLGVAGVVLLAAGAAMIIGGAVRRQVDDQAASGAGPGAVVPVDDRAFRPYPLRLEGHLDAELSRWRWLVKWLLAIPHVVVLVFLWIAFVVLSVVAFFAILFTGRYPRSIFDFNAGVLRWTWRVSYYASSALGTDRYPPFTLDAADYPATLDIDYPEHLSRGLVLVKSWLLAIPHLLIIGVFTATWTFGSDNGGTGLVLAGGLLGLLVVVAALTLAFTGRYPTGLHDLIMGVNRWTYRVIAYVALMTDDYPPFRLDQGGNEPTLRDPTKGDRS